MIDEDVSLGLGVSDCATVMRHGFTGRVGIIELCRRSIQLLTLASLITMFASRQASIHFCRFWCIVRGRRLRWRIFARTCELIQGFGFLLGLVLPTWSEAEDLKMLLNSEIRMEILGSSGSCCIRDSISLVKEDQSTPLRQLVGWLMTKETGR